MLRANDSAARTLGMAGRDIRLKLKAIYGSPEAAETAIREAAKDTQTLEEWGTIVQRRKYDEDRAEARMRGKPFYFSPGVDLAPGESWSFDTIPAPLRELGILSMACAYLVWKHEQEEDSGEAE